MLDKRKLSWYTNRIVLLIGLLIFLYEVLLALSLLNMILPNAKSLDIAVIGVAVSFILGTPALQSIVSNKNEKVNTNGHSEQ